MTVSPFLPQLATVLRNGYGLRSLRADVTAGLTVAIVALPLSLAIAIASGVGPDRGLATAVVGGFLVSALGGARYQIGGPAGAFIVLVSACVLEVGVEGLLLATLLSGVLTVLTGVTRLGGLVRFIPHPVVLGFTAGVGMIIVIAQVHDLAGLQLPGPDPATLPSRLAAYWNARGTVQAAAVLVAMATIALILALRRWRPDWPALLMAVVAVTLGAALLQLPAETIVQRFGALPAGLPAPSLPDLSAPAIWAALPWAASFSLLGAIETLLSATVADAMTGDRHRPGAEMLAQGIANIASALFGGFCVTGLIARTVINIRAGASGPVSGMLHAVFLLGFMLVAAPLAGYIPLAVLAGVLVVVAFGMFDGPEWGRLWRLAPAEVAVALATFLLVVAEDLIVGIATGCALAAFISARWLLKPGGYIRRPDGSVALTGPYHFAAAARHEARLEEMASSGRLIMDLSAVSGMDSTGALSLARLAARLQRQGGQLHVTAVPEGTWRRLRLAGMAAECRLPTPNARQANGSSG